MTDLENEDKGNLLCPELIDQDDYLNYIEKLFDKDELKLFHKWYKLNDKKKIYTLELNFSNEQSNSSQINELNKLLDIFYNKFDQALNSSENLKFKYLKTIQQDEIEFITNNHADTISIVWFHITNSNDNGDSSSNLSESIKKFNQLRYRNLVHLLQSQVLTQNYKNLSKDELYSNDLNTNKKLLEEFLLGSIKDLLDRYIDELNKVNSLNITTSKYKFLVFNFKKNCFFSNFFFGNLVSRSRFIFFAFFFKF